MNWQELIAFEPRLEDFSCAAVQSAKNGWYGWVEWFPHFSGFRQLVGLGTHCAALQNWEAFDTAVALLIDRHRVERARVERHRSKRSA
jgi:hypothetical protein